MNKFLIFVLIALAIVAGLLVYYFQDDIQIIDNMPIIKSSPKAQINSFEECAAKYLCSNPIRGSAKRQAAKHSRKIRQRQRDERPNPGNQPMPNTLVASR